jgi:hypothetical protein
MILVPNASSILDTNTLQPLVCATEGVGNPHLPQPHACSAEPQNQELFPVRH